MGNLEIGRSKSQSRNPEISNWTGDPGAKAPGLRQACEAPVRLPCSPGALAPGFPVQFEIYFVQFRDSPKRATVVSFHASCDLRGKVVFERKLNPIIIRCEAIGEILSARPLKFAPIQEVLDGCMQQIDGCVLSAMKRVRPLENG